MTKPKKKSNQGRFVWFILLGLIGLGYLISVLIRGTNFSLFNNKGLIAHEQHNLMMYTAGVMLLIAVPSVLLLYFTAWKYRETNTKATYAPNTPHSKKFELFAWGAPFVVMVILASMMWPATHRLQPQKAIAADNQQMTIQVISLRWKWLFIYPEQGIATVNFVQMPVNTPVQFELTADETPMSSFWIPNIGGQLYSMTGHVNRLNLMADTAGDYPGSSAELNGAGFSSMKFTARASSMESFNDWVNEVKQSPEILNSDEYGRLLRPTENVPPAIYSSFDQDLYDTVISKYNAPGEHHH